jgi:hypothetical protein
MSHRVQSELRKVALCALALSLLACGSASREATPASGSSGSSAATTTTQQAGPAGTPQDLTFTGTPAGHLDRATGDYLACQVVGRKNDAKGGRYFIGPLRGDVGGARYEFQIQILTGYHGPGIYKTGEELTPGSGVGTVTVSVVPSAGPNKTPDSSLALVSAPGAATVVVGPDETTGTVEADLGGKAGKTHVSGTWRCPAS